MNIPNEHCPFECVKLLVDETSFDVIELTAQIYSEEGSQIAVAIDEKLAVREIVSPSELFQKFCHGIGASSVKEIHNRQ